jgi:hypothetical protein
MHRELRPQPRIAPSCAYCNSRERPVEPADRHALRLGVPGHVESRRRRAEPSLLRGRGIAMRERVAYAALIASPLIELAASAAPLSTIAA